MRPNGGNAGYHAAVASQDHVQAKVQEAVGTWKRQLLDLTRRNRALNFRPLKVSTVAIVDELPAEIYRLLVHEERALTFAVAARTAAAGPTGSSGPTEPTGSATADGEDPFAGEEHVTGGAAIAAYTPDTLQGAHTDTVLQTTLDAEALDRSLRRIEEQARLSVEEQGVNTLFLTLGLLHYTEAEASDEVFRAPLVLVPVSLRRESARSPFVLEPGDDEPMVNPALVELLRRQHDVSLPDLPSDAETSLQPFLAEVQAVIARLPAARANRPWTLTTDVFLGLFAFQKLVMYKDLEANAGPLTAHRLVTQLITRRGSVPGGGLGLPDDVRQARLDESYPPERGAHVVDADGSQQRALAAADRGYDLVVEGPPGTGKSQTITNLIAQALHGGKSVLFVAEKMAALDVVHRRLQEAGLGEFCLELHSTKASKREVIRSIAGALDASLQPAPDAPDHGAALREVRSALGAYVEALHAPFGALQVTPYGGYGELAHVLDAPRLPCDLDVAAITRPQLDDARSRLQALASAAEAAGDPRTHPWRDTTRTFYPQDQLDAVVDAARDAARAVADVEGLAAEASRLIGVPTLTSVSGLDGVLAAADLLRRSPGASVDILRSSEWDAVPPDAAAITAAVREAQRLEQSVAARFTPEARDGDHGADIGYMEEHAGLLGTWFWWLDSRQRAIRQRWLTYRLPAYTPSSYAEQAHDLKAVAAVRQANDRLAALTPRARALFGSHWRGASSSADGLDAFAAWAVEFRAAYGRGEFDDTAMAVAARGDVDLSAVVRLEEAVGGLSARLDTFAALVQWDGGTTALAALAFGELGTRLRGLVEHAALAGRWGGYVAARQDVRETVAAPALAAADGATMADLPRAFLRTFWFAWLARAVAERPPLARFQALTHDQRVREFQALDRQVLIANRARLVATLRGRVQTRLREDDVDQAMPILRREMAKQRNHRPIRETLRLADAAVRAIKPVFLMSPLSVAQFTRGDAPSFDLVVFDEASQLPPEDAVGSVARGRQLVVVGDPKQLPPTSFFAAASDAPPIDEDEALPLPDAESILEAFMGCGVPMSRLTWHYRSAHESLISFSNVTFYDGDLLTFPSVEPLSDTHGLRLEHVADGVYEGKGLNLAEARRVADAVVAFAREQLAATAAGRTPRSLGVGTFNLRQQLAIQDLLEERRRADPAIEPFFDRSRDEPFFVKNLENIQGDERDVIFLSVTYAKGRDGRLRQQFGPLNGDNGWRRLNVITTRARRAMRVFSSMRAGDIHGGQSRGGPLLEAFLDYAESGRLDHPSVTRAAATESPFEREVVQDLQRRGFLVEPQVGVAGYRIDIGVRDPDAPGRFLLGIECDGVAYHSSDTARDRDRLRQQVLEARGWRILRLWSTDWFKDRHGQLERLTAAIAHAQAEARTAREAAAAIPDIVDLSLDKEPPATEAASARPPAAPAPPPVTEARPYVKSQRPSSVPGETVLDCPERELTRIVTAIVAEESPVHEDDVVTRVASFWDQRVGARIRERVQGAIAGAGAAGAISTRGAFLWADPSICAVRDRAGTGIGAERIAPEEFDAAVLATLSPGTGVRRESVMAAARAALGFERIGSTLSAALDAAIDRLVERGMIGEASDGYRRR